MIKKIHKIENFQFFKNFDWEAVALEDFNRNNLIYGWNGSGKTTFANFLRQIEKKQLIPDCGNFKIISNNEVITKDNFSKSNLQLKVFNEEYINETIFKSSKDVDPIFFIGEEDIRKKKIIDEKKETIIRIEKEIDQISLDLDRINKEIEKICRNTARTIRDILRPSELNRYKNYECPELKNRINELKKEDFQNKKLSQEKIYDLTIRIKENSKPTLSNISNIALPHFSDIRTSIETILNEKIVSHVIDRLSEDNDLNQWVRQGLKFSEKNAGICPFCEQKLPDMYITKLEEHFNDSYITFIEKIDGIIHRISEYKSLINIRLPDSARFYEDFSNSCIKIVNDYERHQEENNIFFNQLLSILRKKQENPFKTVDFHFPDLPPNLNDDLDRMNEIIYRHNERTSNFMNKISEAGFFLETHFTAEIMEEFLLNEDESTRLSELKKSRSDEIENIKKEIRDLEIGSFNHARAADSINKDLHNFLSRNEIELTLKDNGYRITRRGEITDRISEGEKTAISFIYFLNSLKDRSIDISNTIVVIDDPISSFDSISLYNAFSYMINRTKNAHQLIVLTHNYTFFKEIKNYFRDKKRIDKSSFYMIKNRIQNGERIAELHPLDKFLLKYSSEYHYLFNLIYKNALQPDKTFEEYYHLPNLSRRFLESFLAFRVPSEIGNFGNQLSKSNIRPEQRTRILRYTDEHSHSDQIRVDNTGNTLYLDETPQVLNDILDLVKTDINHFTEMKQIVENTSMP